MLQGTLLNRDWMLVFNLHRNQSASKKVTLPPDISVGDGSTSEQPPVPSRQLSVQTILVQIVSICAEFNRNLARNFGLKEHQCLLSGCLTTLDVTGVNQKSTQWPVAQILRDPHTHTRLSMRTDS